MNTRKYCKLVRDRIPEIIRNSGKECITRTLSHEDYIDMLDQKLMEELAEYQESKSVEELVDLIEVIAAIAQIRGCSWKELMMMRDDKLKERGSFDEKIILLEVSS